MRIAAVLAVAALAAAAPAFASSTKPLLVLEPLGGALYVPGQTQVVRIAKKYQPPLALVELVESPGAGETATILGTIDRKNPDKSLRQSLAWTVPALESAHCVIRVSGTSKSGDFAIGTSSAFSIDENPSDALDLPLQLQYSANQNDYALWVTRNGTSGSCAHFSQDTASNSGSAVIATTQGTGSALYASNHGASGAAADVRIEAASNNSDALRVTTDGTGGAAYFNVDNSASNDPAVEGVTQGTSAAGYFWISNTVSTAAALLATTYGTGSAIRADHHGTSGDIALFRSGGSTRARIDKTGKGFFDGGTQIGGADLAEAFAVEGAPSDYEPGDVLLVSRELDRTVTKRAEARSTRLAGVYATKPGVLLTERAGDATQRDLIPVGVLGVLPTKVTLEGGAIRRGDLLVASSSAGRAMRAGAAPAVGTVLGRALGEFAGPGDGVVLVLVSVR